MYWVPVWFSVLFFYLSTCVFVSNKPVLCWYCLDGYPVSTWDQIPCTRWSVMSVMSHIVNMSLHLHLVVCWLAGKSTVALVGHGRLTRYSHDGKATGMVNWLSLLIGIFFFKGFMFFTGLVLCCFGDLYLSAVIGYFKYEGKMMSCTWVKERAKLLIEKSLDGSDNNYLKWFCFLGFWSFRTGGERSIFGCSK